MSKRWAAYIRVSTAQQTEGFSLAEQRSTLDKFAAEHDWPYIVFTDAGVSGTGIDRPGLTALFDAVDAGEVIPGYHIVAYHGAVAGSAATMHSFVGGEAFAGAALSQLLGGVLQESIRSVGGNGAVGVRITQLGDLIVAYGTAVTVEPDSVSVESDVAGD